MHTSHIFLPPSWSIRRATYCTHKVAENDLATAFVLVLELVAFAAMFAVNSSVHSYLIVSYSNKVLQKSPEVVAPTFQLNLSAISQSDLV